MSVLRASNTSRPRATGWGTNLSGEPQHWCAGLDHFWKHLQRDGDWRWHTSASQSAPERETGCGCCKTPNEKHCPTSAATGTMHRTARTASLVLHWWSLQQKPPQITSPSDSKCLWGTKSFPQQLLKSRWKGKARAIEMTTDKLSESQPWCWHRTGKEDDFNDELWTLMLGSCVPVPRLLQPDKASALQTVLLTWHRTGACIIMCWSNVESNGPRSEQQLLSPRTLPVSYGSVSANELGLLRPSSSKQWLYE